jgi:FkbM family methyltransferase
LPSTAGHFRAQLARSRKRVDELLRLTSILQRARSRFHSTAKLWELTVRRKISGKTIWIDYVWLRLPFHGDGDLQELYYHLSGAEWWENERKLLEPYLTEGSVVVDVGANIGFMTALFAKTVKESGLVHSFEPSPIAFRKLQAVIEVNDLKNVKAHNVGCGERDETKELYGAASSGHASLNRPGNGPFLHSQRVRIIRLDDYLSPQLSRLDLMKIDTEGFEDSVLAGASELLERFRPAVYLELTSEYFDSSNRAVSLLKALNYRFVEEPVLAECHNGQNFVALPA